MRWRKDYEADILEGGVPAKAWTVEWDLGWKPGSVNLVEETDLWQLWFLICKIEVRVVGALQVCYNDEVSNAVLVSSQLPELSLCLVPGEWGLHPWLNRRVYFQMVWLSGMRGVSALIPFPLWLHTLGGLLHGQVVRRTKAWRLNYGFGFINTKALPSRSWHPSVGLDKINM